MGDPGTMMGAQMIKQEMQAKQQQKQAKLDDVAVRMNAADGAIQQDLMAELLTKLVEQRGAMQSMMMRMQPIMTQHLKSVEMSGCPIMEKTQGDELATKN